MAPPASYDDKTFADVPKKDSALICPATARFAIHMMQFLLTSLELWTAIIFGTS